MRRTDDLPDQIGGYVGHVGGNVRGDERVEIVGWLSSCSSAGPSEVLAIVRLLAKSFGFRLILPYL